MCWSNGAALVLLSFFTSQRATAREWNGMNKTANKFFFVQNQTYHSCSSNLLIKSTTADFPGLLLPRRYRCLSRHHHCNHNQFNRNQFYGREKKQWNTKKWPVWTPLYFLSLIHQQSLTEWICLSLFFGSILAVSCCVHKLNGAIFLLFLFFYSYKTIFSQKSGENARKGKKCTVHVSIKSISSADEKCNILN